MSEEIELTENEIMLSQKIYDLTQQLEASRKEVEELTFNLESYRLTLESSNIMQKLLDEQNTALKTCNNKLACQVERLSKECGEKTYELKRKDEALEIISNNQVYNGMPCRTTDCKTYVGVCIDCKLKQSIHIAKQALEKLKKD